MHDSNAQPTHPDRRYGMGHRTAGRDHLPPVRCRHRDDYPFRRDNFHSDREYRCGRSTGATNTAIELVTGSATGQGYPGPACTRHPLGTKQTTRRPRLPTKGQKASDDPVILPTVTIVDNASPSTLVSCPLRAPRGRHKARADPTITLELACRTGKRPNAAPRRHHPATQNSSRRHSSVHLPARVQPASKSAHRHRHRHAPRDWVWGRS